MVGDSFQCIHSAHAAPPLLSGYSLAASSKAGPAAAFSEREQ